MGMEKANERKHESNSLGLRDNKDDWPELREKVRACTPARLLEGRAGAAYRTATQLKLRADHADARDAVRTELQLNEHLGAEFDQSSNTWAVPQAH